VPEILTWLDIRAEFLRLKRERNLTQAQIAAMGGTVQHNISKWLHNEHQGPQIGNFMKAIAGLGLSPAEFFVGLERHRLMQRRAPASLRTRPNLFLSYRSASTMTRKLEILKHAIQQIALTNEQLQDRLAAMEENRLQNGGRGRDNRHPLAHKHE